MLVQRSVKRPRQCRISPRLRIIERLEYEHVAIRIETSKEFARFFSIRRWGLSGVNHWLATPPEHKLPSRL